MHDVQKPVREYLRSADVLLELLRNGARLSPNEMTVLQAYTTQLKSFLVLQDVDDSRTHADGDGTGSPSDTAKSDSR
jgi:hypothetical protein